MEAVTVIKNVYFDIVKSASVEMYFCLRATSQTNDNMCIALTSQQHYFGTLPDLSQSGLH